MRGFIQSYFKQRKNVKSSHRIMYYFKPEQLPVLSNLALEYVVFNRWFASIPGPTLCNRAFAHYGTSFGHVGMEMKYFGHPIKSIYERLHAAGRTTKLYYFDGRAQRSSWSICCRISRRSLPPTSSSWPTATPARCPTTPSSSRTTATTTD